MMDDTVRGIGPAFWVHRTNYMGLRFLFDHDDNLRKVKKRKKNRPIPESKREPGYNLADFLRMRTS